MSVDCQSEIIRVCAVKCNCVEGLEGGDEVVEVGGVVIFYPKVIDNESECDGVGGVTLEGQGMFDEGVAKRGKVDN